MLLFLIKIDLKFDTWFKILWNLIFSNLKSQGQLGYFMSNYEIKNTNTVLKEVAHQWYLHIARA